jgi:hypothetical protein
VVPIYLKEGFEDNIGVLTDHMPEELKNATGRCNELDGDVFFEYVAHVTELAKTNEIYEEISAKF